MHVPKPSAVKAVAGSKDPGSQLWLRARSAADGQLWVGARLHTAHDWCRAKFTRLLLHGTGTVKLTRKLVHGCKLPKQISKVQVTFPTG
jgi:hypothetical protein